MVQIGMLEGPDEYVIGQLAGTLLLPGDSILIADATAHELRVFDPSGKFARKVGRKGDGPGEFTWLTAVHVYAGDSIVVLDHEGGRANVLGRDFGYARRFRPRLLETRARPPMTSHDLIGFFSDGRALVSDFLNVCGPRRTDGFCEDSVAFYRTNEDGSTEARLGSFVYSREESVEVRSGPSTGWSEPHPQPMRTLHDNRFYYGDAKRFEIQVFGANGELERRIRVAGIAPRYQKKDVWAPPSPAAAANPRLKGTLAALEAARAKATMPDTFPSFSDLLVDQAGNIWVREYVPQMHLRKVRPRWYVFDPEGRLRWSLRSTPGMMRFFRPYTRKSPQIANDRVLTTVRDADNVESVVVYRLVKRN
ncbi:MAG: 6-bladed beta-propeller [Gemmatimonadota bacterium]